MIYPLLIATIIMLVWYIAIYTLVINHLPPEIITYLMDNPGVNVLARISTTLIGIAALYKPIAYFCEPSKKEQKIENENGRELSDPSELTDLSSKTGIAISRNFRANTRVGSEHIGVLGPTGAGKTTSMYLPNLLDEKSMPGSVIINDIKGDIIKDTANARIEMGSKVYMFSPFEPLLSVRINPLMQVNDASSMRQLAYSLLINGNGSGSSSNQEWISMANPLLSAVLIAARIVEENPTISKCIRKIIQNNDDQLAKYIRSSGDMEAEDSWNLYKQSAGASSTASGIRTVLGSSLQLFLDRNVEYVLSGNDIDLSKLRSESISLYIHVPESKATYAKSLMATFYYMIFDILSNTEGGPVYSLLDEFGNLGHIPNFHNFVTLFRGRNLPLIIGIQSLSQIKSIYGEDADTIMDNIKTKVFFPGMGLNSAQYAAQVLQGATMDGNILDESRIRQLPDNKVIVVCRNRFPIIDDSNYYKLDKTMVEKVSNHFNVSTLHREREVEPEEEEVMPREETKHATAGLSLIRQAREEIPKVNTDKDDDITF